MAVGLRVGNVGADPQAVFVDGVGDQVVERLLPGGDQRVVQLVALVQIDQGLATPAEHREVVVVVGIIAVLGRMELRQVEFTIVALLQDLEVEIDAVAEQRIERVLLTGRSPWRGSWNTGSGGSSCGAPR